MTIGVLVVIGGLGFAGGISALRETTDDVIRRIRGASRDGSVETGDRTGSGLARQLGPLARLTGAGDEEVSRLRSRLSCAGYRGEHATQVFLASKVLLGVGALVAFAFVNAVRAEPIRMALPISVWMLGCGFFAPNLWLRSRVTNRQRAIERTLPDTLDLLVTCVESGLALDAAFQRVGTEIAPAAPVLAEELNLTFLEVKAGIPRTEAMRRLAERTGVTELRSLSATLNQTEMFGTSVAAALRVQADDMRVRRSQRAEERAAYLAVKMTLPLAFCILPCLFAVILGPAAVNIMIHLLGRR
jgi:tight adherence protein C